MAKQLLRTPSLIGSNRPFCTSVPADSGCHYTCSRASLDSVLSPSMPLAATHYAPAGIVPGGSLGRCPRFPTCHSLCFVACVSQARGLPFIHPLGVVPWWDVQAAWLGVFTRRIVGNRRNSLHMCRHTEGATSPISVRLPQERQQTHGEILGRQEKQKPRRIIFEAFTDCRLENHATTDMFGSLILMTLSVEFQSGVESDPGAAQRKRGIPSHQTKRKKRLSCTRPVVESK